MKGGSWGVSWFSFVFIGFYCIRGFTGFRFSGFLIGFTILLWFGFFCGFCVFTELQGFTGFRVLWRVGGFIRGLKGSGI